MLNNADTEYTEIGLQKVAVKSLKIFNRKEEYAEISSWILLCG